MMQFAALPTSSSPTLSRRGPSLSPLKGGEGYSGRFISGRPLSRLAGDDRPAPKRSQCRFDVIKAGGAPPEQASHLGGFPTQSLRKLLCPETLGAHCPLDFEFGGSRCG